MKKQPITNDSMTLLIFESHEDLLGACIIDESDFLKAVKIAWQLKINPGGQVAGLAMNEKQFMSMGLEKNKLIAPKKFKAAFNKKR